MTTDTMRAAVGAMEFTLESLRMDEKVAGRPGKWSYTEEKVRSAISLLRAALDAKPCAQCNGTRQIQRVGSTPMGRPVMEVDACPVCAADSVAALEEGGALARFNECDGADEPDPLERLRFFCSLAMNGRDWMDVEPFFDALAASPTAAPKEEAPSNLDLSQGLMQFRNAHWTHWTADENQLVVDCFHALRRTLAPRDTQGDAKDAAQPISEPKAVTELREALKRWDDATTGRGEDRAWELLKSACSPDTVRAVLAAYDATLSPSLNEGKTKEDQRG